ncbi:MAG TPA: hypothetical protein VE978_19955 [Chitinophagales bacterium]|nr:hypothetical protein [Chitinophagales bacterium]
MELKELPVEIDLEVDPRPLTKEEQKAISEFIKADKLRRAKHKSKKPSVNSSRKKVNA